MTDLSSLPRMRPGVRRCRASTWDRTGGNDDAWPVQPGGRVVIAEGAGPGRVTHIWMTLLSPDLWWGRTCVLRAFWDGEATPSVEVPLGDFFGAGNCIAAEFSSTVLEIAPRDALSLHSWFPMPYADGFRIEVENQSDLPVLALYAYVDYESWPEADPSLGRFHAWWNRTRPERAPREPGIYEPALHASAEGNHLFLSARGRGHYVGAALYVCSEDGGWYGEGDDMIFVDSEDWPPSLHGTGTEDYFGTAWGPATEFSRPSFGSPLAEREDWAGFSHLYRFHLEDPVTFGTSVRATIERGHANDRADDLSSVAYWYQAGRTHPLPSLPPLEERLPPWPPAWRRRREAVAEVFAAALARGDTEELARHALGAGHIMRLAAARDWEGIDAACAWLGGRTTPPRAPARRAAPLPSLLDELREAPGEVIRARLAAEDPDSVLERVFGAWAADFDPEEARGMQAVFGFRVRCGGEEHLWEIAVREGRCAARRGAGSYQRVTFTADLESLVLYTLGRLDLWEAALRGTFVARGDSSMALRLPVFGRRRP